MTARDDLADLIEDTLELGYTGRKAEAVADAIIAKFSLAYRTCSHDGRAHVFNGPGACDCGWYDDPNDPPVR